MKWTEMSAAHTRGSLSAIDCEPQESDDSSAKRQEDNNLLDFHMLSLLCRLFQLLLLSLVYTYLLWYLLDSLAIIVLFLTQLSHKQPLSLISTS